MRVFVTGGSGFVGLPTIHELLTHKHTVLALSRSSTSADILTKAGAEIHRGDLNDLESLKSATAQCDGVIHLGFAHDGYSFTAEAFAKAIATETAAIEAMAEALRGTGKPLVITSGTFMVAGHERATEESESLLPEGHPFNMRGASERLVERLSEEKSVRGMTVRLSPTVHGEGDKGFVPMLADLAKKNGFVTVVDGGKARWPAVHKIDAAVLFRLALEKGKAGAMYHGVAEEVETGKTMELVGRNLGLPVKDMSADEAMGAIGFMGFMLGMDSPVSSEKTQRELGWTPKEPGLLADVEANYPLSA